MCTPLRSATPHQLHADSQSPASEVKDSNLTRFIPGSHSQYASPALQPKPLWVWWGKQEVFPPPGTLPAWFPTAGHWPWTLQSGHPRDRSVAACQEGDLVVGRWGGSAGCPRVFWPSQGRKVLVLEFEIRVHNYDRGTTHIFVQQSIRKPAATWTWEVRSLVVESQF